MYFISSLVVFLELCSKQTVLLPLVVLDGGLGKLFLWSLCVQPQCPSTDCLAAFLLGSAFSTNYR